VQIGCLFCRTRTKGKLWGRQITQGEMTPESRATSLKELGVKTGVGKKNKNRKHCGKDQVGARSRQGDIDFQTAKDSWKRRTRTKRGNVGKKTILDFVYSISDKRKMAHGASPHRHVHLPGVRKRGLQAQVEVERLRNMMMNNVIYHFVGDGKPPIKRYGGSGYWPGGKGVKKEEA